MPNYCRICGFDKMACSKRIHPNRKDLATFTNAVLGASFILRQVLQIKAFTGLTVSQRPVNTLIKSDLFQRWKRVVSLSRTVLVQGKYSCRVYGRESNNFFHNSFSPFSLTAKSQFQKGTTSQCWQGSTCQSVHWQNWVWITAQGTHRVPARAALSLDLPSTDGTGVAHEEDVS